MRARATALSLAGLLALGGVAGCSEEDQGEAEQQIEEGGQQVEEGVEEGVDEVEEQVGEGAEEGDEG